MKKITYDDVLHKLVPAFAFPFCLTAVLIRGDYKGISVFLGASLLYAIICIVEKCEFGDNHLSI